MNTDTCNALNTVPGVVNLQTVAKESPHLNWSLAMTDFSPFGHATESFGLGPELGRGQKFPRTVHYDLLLGSRYLHV